MSKIRLDKNGQVQVSSPGMRAIEETEKQLDPRVKEVIGENEPLKLSALNTPSHDGNSIYQILDDNDDVLDNNQKELKDLTPRGFDSTEGQTSLDKMVQFLRDKQSLAQLAADAVKNNPTLMNDVKDVILKKGTSLLDKAGRTLNFLVAVESGAANGLIRSMRGEGTVMDSVNESVRNNTGFGKTLELLGVPKGPEGQLRLPQNIRLLTPSIAAYDLVRAKMEGKDPFELRPFGPVLSTRGAVGFGLDVLLDPLTYVSLGANLPQKVAATKGQSLVRFAGKTLLGDKELKAGLSALKSTKGGHAVLEAIDKFTAFQFAKNVSLKDVGDNLARKFLPDYGIHKPTADILEKADRYRMRDMEDAAKLVKGAFEGFTDEDKIKFAEEMFNRNRRESVFRRLKNRAGNRLAKSDETVKVAGYVNAEEAFQQFRALPKKVQKQLIKGETFNKKLYEKLAKDVDPKDVAKLQRITDLVEKRSLPSQEALKLAKVPKNVLKKFRDLKFDPTQSVGLQKFTNPKFQKAADTLVGKEGLVTNLAKFAGLPEEILYDNYIPGIFEESFGKAVGDIKSGAKKKLLSTGRFRKEFKVKPTDPENAYITRLAELVTVGHTRRAIKNIIKRYGATYDDAMKQGFDEFFPKDAVKKFGDPKAFDRVDDLGLTSKSEKVYLPKQVIETVTEMASRQNIQNGAFLKMMGAFTQQFKAYVTSIWPAFHARNAFSNQVLRFNNEGWKAFNVGTNADAFKMLIDSPALENSLVELGKNTGKKVPLRVIKKWADADGITNTNQFLLDVGGSYLDALSEREITAKFAQLVTPNMSKNAVVKIGREIGGFIENHAKLTSYTQALKDGFSRKEAAQIAFQGLFDYGHLTSFEKKVMRRIFPFYTFSRKNLEGQMRTALTNPGRQAATFKLIKDLRDDALANLNPEQLEAFNDWRTNTNAAQNSFAIPGGFDKDGNVLWVTGLGLPQEDVLDLFNAQGLLFRTNPLIKLPANEMLRRMDQAGVISFKENYTMKELQFLFNDVFTTRQSQEKVKEWVNDPNGMVQHPLAKFLGLKVVERPVIENGRPTGEKEFMFNADPRMLDVLRNTLIARHASTLRQFSDPNTDESMNMIRFLTGITVYNQNLERAMRSQAGEIKSEVAQKYKENGLGYLFTRPGVAKDADFDLKKFNKRLGDF